MSSEENLGNKIILIALITSVLLSGGSYAKTQKPVPPTDLKDPLIECLDTIDARYKIAIKEVTQVERNFKALLGKETP